jgi:predicted amidohydrolase
MKTRLFLLIAGAILALSGCSTLQIMPYDTSGSQDILPVAMVSIECSLDPISNRLRMVQYIAEIMEDHPDVKLICFGETILGWYWKPCGAREYQESVAETIEGTTISLMKALALENDVYISFGFAESGDGAIYNSAVIIDDGGNIIAHRHKSEFVPMDRWSGFTAGEKIVTTAYIEDIKVALLICNDFNKKSFQEQIKSDPDIKILMLPHATANLEPDFWERYRYNYNGLWLLSAQRYGEENRRRYYGSWILDPNGYMVSFSEGGAGYFYHRVPIK